MALQASNIALRYGHLSLLDGIDFTLKPGKVHVILGPNGAGKTSLLRILCGDLSPSRGEVMLHGQPYAEWSSLERARRLAVLPQHTTLNFPFTAEEVVQLGRTPHTSGVVRDKQIISAALARVDGSYLANRFYTQLSGGEKQRVQLARVLAQIWPNEDDNIANDGRVLILDEPTASFDLAHQQLLVEVVREFAAQGVAVAMVVHDLNLALQCADTVTLLSCGRVAASGSPAGVMRAELLQQVFSARLDVITHPTSGRPLIIS